MAEFAKWKGKRIGVAVSGGVDSVSLLHYLVDKSKRFDFSVCAVHCEHGLRGDDSLADMRFVENLCRERGVKLFLFRENCAEKAAREKTSVETAARDFRREAFAQLKRDGVVDYIATAHHQNDEAETVLFRLARGASLGGVVGMQEESGYILRPFLGWTRAEIEAYAKENGLAYCTDKSNFQPCATRNKLRLGVLPALEEAMPGASGNLARFAMQAAQDDALLQKYADALLLKTEEGFLVAFSAEPSLFRRACLKALKGLGVESDYTFAHLESAFFLQQSERGAYLCLPKGVIAKKTEKGVALFREKEEIFPPLPQPKPFDESGFDGGRYVVNIVKEPTVCQNNAWKTLKIDGEKMPRDAVFRFREEGDEIKLFGGGTKSLKKLLNEKKLPVEERGYLPVIAQAGGKKVYAVCGVEIADELKVDENTVRVLYIVLQRK